MVRIAIVEDEKVYREQLTQYLKRYEEESGEHFRIQVFEDGEDLLEGYQPEWDLIFMDIRMQFMDGMTAARKLREYDSAALLIFITTMAQYAIKGYEVDAMDFVLKPVQYPQFCMKLRKALNRIRQMEARTFLMLPIGEHRERVCTDDILYIESRNHDLQFITREKTYEMRGAMADMEKKLEGCQFARCGQSYLVNVKQVTAVEKDVVILASHRLPISRSRKRAFLQAMADYLETGYL